MAKLNENKIDLIVEHFTSGGEATEKAIIKAAGLNPRYKTWKKYIAAAHEKAPDVVPKSIDATGDEEEEDIDGDDMLGDETEVAPVACPEGKSEDECCGSPEKCSKKKEAPKKKYTGNVVADAAAAPKSEEPSEGIDYIFINKNNLATKLEVVKFDPERKRVILKEKTDEVVEVEIQGVKVKVNLTQLEAEGKTAEAAFYRSQAK